MALDTDRARQLVRLSQSAYRSEQRAGDDAAALGLGEFRFYSGQSTQAFTATDADHVHLAFRGTEATNPVDWAKDAQFRPTTGEFGAKVHSGFRSALDEVWSDISPVITAANKPAFVTGHSLGAALAALAGARLSEAGLAVAGVYTFGQPRTGLKDFRTAYDAKLGDVTLRFVNHIDLVTRVPLLIQGYRHVGARMYFDGSGNFHPNASAWEVAKEDLAFRLTHFGRIKAAGLTPHEISAYVRLVDTI